MLPLRKQTDSAAEGTSFGKYKDNILTGFNLCGLSQVLEVPLPGKGYRLHVL